MRLKKYLLLHVILIPLLFIGQQDGQYDLSFANNGALYIEFSEEDMLLSSFVEQQDQKLIFSGNRFIYNYIIRVNNDGSFDNSFANNGIATFSYDVDEILNIQSLIVLPDGKILGFSNTTMNNELVLFRFNSNGTIDQSFGVSGYMKLPWLQGDAKEMYFTSDNKFILIVQNYSNVYFLRLNTDYSLDLSYGNQGITNVNLSSYNISLLDFVHQNDEKIIFGASYTSGGTKKALTSRLTEGGHLDSSYGANQNGISAGVELPLNGNIKIGQFSDNTYVLGYGSSEISNPQNQKSYLYKLTNAGLLNTTFGNNGEMEIGDFVLNNIIVQPNNRILVSGNVLAGPNYFGQMHIKRYYSTGTIDNTFGNNGELFYSQEISHQFIELQNDGKLLAFNRQQSMFSSKYHILRFNNNPLSILEFDPQAGLVFPNPSTGNFYLRVEHSQLNTEYIVIDTLGKKILDGKLSNLTHSIDIGTQPIGMYYLITPFKTFKLVKK